MITLFAQADSSYGLQKTAEEAFGSGNLPTKDLPTLIGQIISAGLGLLGIVFLILMLYGGYLWMTARGETEKVDKAKDLITAAIIGLIIVVGAYAISNLVVVALTTRAR